MNTRSSSRLSRLSDRATTVQRQLIAFPLAHSRFLLPIQSVYRATIFAKTDLDQGTLLIDGHLLPVINIKPLILGQALEHLPDSTLSPQPLSEAVTVESELAESEMAASETAESAIAVLILQHPNGQPSHIVPIDSAPALCRISEDYFVPLPQAYTMNSVAEMTDRQSDYPLHFVISPERLLHQLTAPSAESLTPL